jgi:hypothetical protein
MTELAASREYIPSTSDRLLERAQLVGSVRPRNPETLQQLLEYTDIIPTIAAETQGGFSSREGNPRDKTPYAKAVIDRLRDGIFLTMAGRQVASGKEKFRQEYELRVPLRQMLWEALYTIVHANRSPKYSLLTVTGGLKSTRYMNLVSRW